MFRVDFIVDSPMGFGPVLQPHQHLAKAQTSQVEPTTATLTTRQHFQGNQTHTFRSSKAIPTYNKRSSGSRLHVRIRAWCI